MDTPLTPAQSLELDRLVRRHRPALERWAWKLARRSGDDPQDILAEGLCRVAREFPRYDPRRSSFLTWAGWRFRSAWEHLLVGRHRQKRPVFQEITDRQWLVLEDPDGSQEMSVLDRLEIQEVLWELPPAQRSLLERRADGWTLNELRQESGVSQQMMHYRLKQAQAAAREVAFRKFRGTA